MRETQTDPLERARAIVYAAILRERSGHGFGSTSERGRRDPLDQPWIVAAQVFAFLLSVPLLIWLFAGH